MQLSVPFLDLSRRIANERPELEAAFARVLDSGRFVLGPEVEAFETSFAAFCGAAHAVGVGSGTDAITIGLLALGVGAGDEVLAPAFTCVPTIVGIERSGATPVLVDVDESTFTLNPDLLPAALTARTRAVIPVHLYGRCADLGAISSFATDHGIAVLSDAAQAHGASWGRASIAAISDVTAFSFYPTKNLAALGDGGAIVTDHADVAERASRLRNLGEAERFRSIERGFTSRLDSVQSALLAMRLPRLRSDIARRRSIAARYRRALADTPARLPAPLAGDADVHHLFVVRTPDRSRFRARLAELGVETDVHYPRAIPDHPGYAGLGETAVPVSRRLAREIVSLPLYPELTDDEVELVAASAREAALRERTTNAL